MLHSVLLFRWNDIKSQFVIFYGSINVDRLGKTQKPVVIVIFLVYSTAEFYNSK